MNSENRSVATESGTRLPYFVTSPPNSNLYEPGPRRQPVCVSARDSVLWSIMCICLLFRKRPSVARAVGEAHCLCTRRINFREGVRDYLFQGRFSSCPVSTDHYLLSVLQYILRNPVKAKMAQHPWEYQWSSAAFHCGHVTHDILVQKDDMSKVVSNLKELLNVDSKFRLYHLHRTCYSFAG